MDARSGRGHERRGALPDLHQDIGRILHEEYEKALAHFEARIASEVGELDVDQLLDMENAIMKEEAAMQST